MKIKFTFTLLFVGLFCFGQITQKSIAVQKKKQSNEIILAQMIKRKEQVNIKLAKNKNVISTDSVKVDDKAIFDKVFIVIKDSLATK